MTETVPCTRAYDVYARIQKCKNKSDQNCDLGRICGLTQMFRENECKNSSRAWIEESWKELWWQTVKLSYRAGDGPSIYILGPAGILIISGPILQLPELTADFSELECEKNVNEM